MPTERERLGEVLQATQAQVDKYCASYQDAYGQLIAWSKKFQELRKRLKQEAAATKATLNRFNKALDAAYGEGHDIPGPSADMVSSDPWQDLGLFLPDFPKPKDICEEVSMQGMAKTIAETPTEQELEQAGLRPR